MMTRRRGKARKYSKKIADQFCAALATSNKSLSQICKENDSFPASTVIKQWIKDNPEFAASYACAREIQFLFTADEILDITDKLAADPTLTHEKVNAAKLKIDSLKWLASKLLPKKYGDRIDVTSGGKAMERPEPIILFSAEKMTDEEIQDWLKQNDRADDQGGLSSSSPT